MKRKVVALIVALVLLGLAALYWPDSSSKQVLPDGTVLVLSGLRIAQTNAFVHGTRLAKLLSPLMPSNGISVARFKLKHPRTIAQPSFMETECLMGELWLAPGSPRETALVSPPFFRKYRLLLSGNDDHYAFVNEFRGFKNYEDGFFAEIWAYSFPRGPGFLRLRLQERDNAETRAWRDVANFVVKNPKPPRIEAWQPIHSPRLPLADDLEIEVGECTVRHAPIHPTDIWEYTADLPIRMTRNGQFVTNWGILEGKVRDSTGNSDSALARKNMTNDWMVYQMFHPMDPARPWRFSLHLGLDSGFPKTNLFSFAIPLPLPRTLHTNIAGFPCQIGFVNGDMLSVELTSKPSNTRITFVSATDDDGQNLDNWSGSWSQHRFWKSLKSTKASQVHVSVAVRPEYLIEFVLQPRDETGADSNP